jgi:hypothetical protein
MYICNIYIYIIHTLTVYTHLLRMYIHKGGLVSLGTGQSQSRTRITKIPYIQVHRQVRNQLWFPAGIMPPHVAGSIITPS